MQNSGLQIRPCLRHQGLPQKAILPGSTKTNSLIRLDSQGPGQAAWASHQVRRPAQIQQPTLRPPHPHQMGPLAPTPPFLVTRRHLCRTSLSLRHLSPLPLRARGPVEGASGAFALLPRCLRRGTRTVKPSSLQSRPRSLRASRHHEPIQPMTSSSTQHSSHCSAYAGVGPSASSCVLRLVKNTAA